jgi:ectoine hydroxylase
MIPAPITPTPYRTRVSARPSTVPRYDPVVWGTPDGAPPDEGPLDADGLERFADAGYLVLDDLLDDDAVRALLDEVRRLATTADPHDERVIRERGSTTVRSLFEVHRMSDAFASLAASPALAGVARQLLGSEVYLHQSRLNLKPGFRGKEFFWHSDFETWHAEDGMHHMRAVSLSLALTSNTTWNGSLLVIPGSHRWFVGCAGATPPDHHRSSLQVQEYGVPSDDDLSKLVGDGGIDVVVGRAGSGAFFDCNLMHGSSSNITPDDRTNVFFVYNSVDNVLGAPFAAPAPRPTFIAAREAEPL